MQLRTPGLDRTLVFALATSIIEGKRTQLPSWVNTDTRYLILVDVPEAAVLRLPTILRLHKPDQRMHLSRDDGVLRRLVVALHREQPWEGILDAYVLQDLLVVVLGDMTIREFPLSRIPHVGHLGREKLLRFEIDSDGSFLHWPEVDVHIGPSQLLQAVDPMYLADIEIERYAMEKVSLALLDMRTERGLNQGDIPGLSDRHVRRLENEEVRMTVDAAEKLAEAFDLDLSAFLDDLSRRISALRDPAAKATAGSESTGRRQHAD